MIKSHSISFGKLARDNKNLSAEASYQVMALKNVIGGMSAIVRKPGSADIIEPIALTAMAQVATSPFIPPGMTDFILG